MAQADPEDDLRLGTRSGLPDDLLRLRQKYPRDTWPGHANLGEWVRFWLDRHGMFRELGTMLSGACAQLQGGHIGAAELAPWFAPRLEFFLGHLDLHHRIEEFHIFPVFAKAEPALQHGFALLEGDHREVHTLIEALQGSAARLTTGGSRAGDDTSRDLAALTQALNAHLDDEEDLIVPIVLDRSEAKLGLF